jgi:hypothetical protein
MKMPTPPTLEDLKAHIPTIDPISDDLPRPFWSVMIPAYNAGDYLRRTLESVLCQDPGVGQMQIEVVDGRSTKGDPEKIVNEMGAGRVGFHRIPENRGPANTFNACLKRARGQWIHILHGDDVVLPGFYDAYGSAIEKYSAAETVVGQAFIFDDEDIWKAIEGPRPPRGGGILENFVDLVATEWLVLCPAIVVKRTAYEAVGGYCTFFQGADDWEMWMRLGLHSPVACVARPHSMYRRQPHSWSKLLASTGGNVLQEWIAVATNLARIDAAGRPRPLDTTSWRARHAKWATQNARRLNVKNDNVGSYHQARWALLLDPTVRRLATFLGAWTKYSFAAKAVSRSGSPQSAGVGSAQSVLSRLDSWRHRALSDNTRRVNAQPVNSDATTTRKT